MPKIRVEASWLKSNSPKNLLLSFQNKPMPRPRRMFALVCCQRFADEMLREESRLALEFVEKFLAGDADKDELNAAYEAAQSAAMELLEDCQHVTGYAANEAWNHWRLAYAAQLCAAPSRADRAAEELVKRAASQNMEFEERKYQATLIREIFGNPFRPVAKLKKSWLQYQDLGRLARQFSDEEDFSGLPILADLLEEAGCDNEEVLDHLRADIEHFRGCWALDMLIGKR